jgi:phytoene dehydrogenase-like protein
MSEEHAEVAVVGAGIAGLVAASVAADVGARVVVLDANRTGGRAVTDEVRGYQFNRGPRALNNGGVGRPILNALGVKVTGGPPALSMAMVHSAGSLHRLPVGARSILTTSLFGLRAKASFGMFFARLARMPMTQLATMTQAAWLDDADLHPDARALVELLGRLSSYAHAPRVVSADVMAGQLRLKGGVTYVDGGWGTIVGGLRHAAESRGVTFVESGVACVTPTMDGQGYDVELQGSSDIIRARRVVLAAGAPAACAALLPATPAVWQALAPPVMAACLDLGLRRAPRHPIVLDSDEPL